jgi:hypothetical protein
MGIHVGIDVGMLGDVAGKQKPRHLFGGAGLGDENDSRKILADHIDARCSPLVEPFPRSIFF